MIGGIAISAGHYPESPGACNSVGDCEHAEARYWAANLQRRLLREANPVQILRVSPAPLKMKLKQINTAPWVDLVVEIHFNASESMEVSGCETLHYPGSKNGIWAAQLVQDTLVEGMCVRNRGIKEGWYRGDKANGPIYLLQKTKATALIIEPEFIHNMGVIRRQRDIAIKKLSEALVLVLLGLKEI